MGIVGPRQVGKTTLLRGDVKTASIASLDDEDLLAAALTSSKLFLARYERPLAIDEVQKAPGLFDAIKLAVDKKRIPGQFFITGSTQFSARIGIRESLTGRIGIAILQPLTIAEAHGRKPGPPDAALPFAVEPPTLGSDLDEFSQHMKRGGFPVPMFMRDDDARREYWQGWIETTIYRDVARQFRARFDPNFAVKLLSEMASALRVGELPSLRHFSASSPRVRSYLEAFENVFIVRRIPCHSSGTGKDVWLFFDSGIAAHLMKGEISDAVMLSLARHALWQETAARIGFSGRIDNERIYYKSPKGEPVDFIWAGIPFKVVLSGSKLGWEERSLAGAMKALGQQEGYLVAPVEQAVIPKGRKGIGLLPWHYWSG